MNSPKPFRLSILGMAISTCLAQQSAFAQNQPLTASEAAESDVEIIEVTSRQRSENIQNVPIAITAFGQQEIEDLGLERAADFISLTPNMTIVEAQNAGTSFITVRGLSQVRNGESPVAISVDGVLQISPNQFNVDLFDIAQIEVLKGPQGALYGRNAIGGAINITTVMPSDDPMAYVEFDAGNGGLLAMTAAYGGALSDNFFYRLTASTKTFDGLIDNVFLDTPVDFQDDNNIRGRFVWEMSDTFTADLRLSYGDTEGGSLNYVYQPLFGINDASDTSVKIEANNLGINEREIQSASLKLDWQLPGVTASLIAANDNVEEYFSGDQFPYTRNPSATSPFGPNVLDGVQTQYLDTSANSLEFRLTSTDEGPFRWIAGAYMLQTDRYISSATGLDLGLGIGKVSTAPLTTSAISPTLTFLADDNDNQGSALFAQVNFDLNEDTEITFAGRYDKDEREQTNRAPVEFDVNSGEVRSKTFSKFQPKVSLSYTGFDNISLYGTYSVGFRSGGFNQSGVGVAASNVGLDGVSDVYEAEETDNLEVGLKAFFPAIKSRLNVSIFDSTIDNQHYYVFVGAVGAQVLVNIDEVELRGGEIEFGTTLFENLSINASAGITDSEITAYQLEPSTIGNKAPYVPDYTFNLGVQYTMELGSDWVSQWRLDWERRGEQYWDPLNSTARQELDLLSARIGFFNNDNLSVSLWAKNLTDEEYNAEWLLGGFAHPAAPRSYGVEVRWDFF